ncbi:uncharacterized protein [Henckelia pumila]|uniref:uncharacterized protein n=1 Tax=Henckelia pumila TaxID=405737 RepID=UPI003C6DC219
MPFWLKNAGATYQCLVNTMFERLIGNNMKVYIDDMLVKSTQTSNHLKDLGECFSILRKYRMKLNPNKCTFGIRGGKFLGYMVSERGIEANPEKIKAILNINPPKSVKGIQELTGRLAALNRFISRSADKGLPLFKLLRSGKGSGAGIVVESPQGDKFQYAIKFLFPATNNEAEYEAFIMGIKLALSVGAKKLTIHSDSQLIVSQVNENYEAKEDKILEYLTQVNEILSRLDSYDIKQIPRAENESAERLAKLASSLANIDNRKITFLKYGKEKTDGSDVTIFCADSKEPGWKDEIIDYLRQGNLPFNQVEARKLRVRAARFTTIDGELYKRGFSSPYLKCLTPAKGNYVLREIHEGICENRLAGRALAGKALHQGYL